MHPPIYHGTPICAVYVVANSAKLGFVAAKLTKKAGLFKELARFLIIFFNPRPP
jgi:hypothetical protein